MDNTETYAGWSNQETWAINLHLSNEYGDYLYFCEQAREVVENEDSEDQVGALARIIEQWTEEVFDSVTHPEDGEPNELARMFVADVGSWWRADFYEIAQGWIEEARESVKSES